MKTPSLDLSTWVRSMTTYTFNIKRRHIFSTTALEELYSYLSNEKDVRGLVWDNVTEGYVNFNFYFDRYDCRRDQGDMIREIDVLIKSVLKPSVELEKKKIVTRAKIESQMAIQDESPTH